MCVSDRENSIIKFCAKNSNLVCIDSSQTMCVLLNSNPNDNFIGSYLDNNQNLICIQQTDIQLKSINPSSIQFLIAGYCYKQDNLIYQGQQVQSSFLCNCPKNYCYDGIDCIKMDQNLYAGKNTDGQCVALSVSDNILSCFDDELKICLFQISQNSSKCISYDQNVDVIGVFYYQNVNYCLQQSQINQITIIDRIVTLKSTYCYNHNKFLQIPDNNQQIIGITSQFNCFLSNSPINQSDPIKFCIQGYCISQQKCILMNNYNVISKRQDSTCGGNSEKNFLECYTSNIYKTTCINGDQCELILQSSNFVGALTNFNCVKTNQETNIDTGPQILYCSQYFCISEYQDKIVVGHNILGNIYQTVQKQKCQQIGSICQDDNQCLQYNSAKKKKLCVKLTTDLTQPNFAKELNTQNCLSYQPITGKAQNIDKCPNGFCIYMQSETQKYCVALGSFINGNQYIGVELFSQICLQQLQLSYLGISQCYGDNCILKYSNYYVCHPLQDSSQYFQASQSVKAKLSDSTCADLNKTVSVNCLSGDYCILKDACVPLDSSNQFTIGRNLQDQKCLPQNTSTATNCAQNYCLLNGQCLPLSMLNPGRENQTGKCLKSNDSGMFGASSCYINYCLLKGRRYIGTGICVSQNDQNIPHLSQLIQFCFKGVYCIASNSNGDYCQKVEGIYKCSDSLGRCILQTDTTTPCSSCSFNECFQNGNCIGLENKYCQDNNGKCIDVNIQGCQVCPLNYCLQMPQQICLYYNQLDTSSYSYNECIYQYRQDMPCFKQNIDEINQNKILLCKNKNNFCQDIVKANQEKQCLVCPKYFYNPGDHTCYQQVKQAQNSYFNYELQYILEDCYPNPDCSSNSQKCPEGFYKGYFLYEDAANQNYICIKCLSQQYIQNIDPSSSLFKFINQITYMCAECNLELNQWGDQTLTNKICTQMVITIAGLQKFDPYFSQTIYYQIQKGPTQELPYYQQFKKPLSNLYLQQLQVSDQCSNNCIRCIQDQSGANKCLKCDYLFYVTPQYVCQPCPSQCLECGMSILQENQFFNFEDLSYEEYLSGVFNMDIATFSCRFCQAGFLINFDFQTCVQCGIQCQECVYMTIDGQLVNKKYYNFHIYASQNLIPYCLKCSPGFQRSANRFDCSQIVANTQPSCYDYDFISSINLPTNVTFAGSNYEYNLCQYGYPLIIATNGQLSCDENQYCKDLMLNCLNCYEFQNYQDGSLYQCIQCKEGYIPSISGCIPCPNGCLNCYEVGMYQQKGRILSNTQSSCVFPVCGKYCQTCIFYQDQPFCVQCNSNLLFSEIASIQMYIAQMYFNTVYFDQINLMISFDQKQQNCKLCPMLCETCEDKSKYFINGAFDLYDSKCYSCKQKIISQYQELERYEIRYDKKKMKCQLCLKGDNGCYFTKKSHVYVFCGTYEQNLGSGTKSDPYNLFKISQVNIDRLILNEEDLNRAYVFYNELQLRELELIIQYVDQSGVCIENLALNLQSNLKNTINSLKFMTLTIKADQNQDNNTYFTVQQIAIAQIQGFSQIQIQNINFVSKYSNGNFGFFSQNTEINSIQLQNVTFSSKSLSPNLLQLININSINL
ncbi:hypothetical protein TTHERM_01292210 (macronuclear) [Tetrahymena thermophila SB210]|uniref:Uncharacterized protein n=1 Tax=Tetrahymena thermophila (strain SB210) TaxID=312017 RepID=Q22KZ7_TETTS|nr:hypothetical protein TTHERM_01292210 [Tetrahymena thermophila SB210]EAR85951.2 hypothetical protein TTHERM_01292210 [Tetrahymena thermophila SB210]|eukprot:XP_976546.2 hypothetical protein TTHERM_01292210 [Tetrahymena thermophila SB210]